MTAFLDIRDLARQDRQRRLYLCRWLIAVTALTLVMFFLNYLDLEYPAYVICTVLSLVAFAAELVCIFRASACRVTPLLIFLVALYLTRNSQLLLILFGVQFDAHDLILLQQHLKGAIVLTSVGNLWAGFAGLIVAAPVADESRRSCAGDEWDSPLSGRILAIGAVLTGLAAYAELILSAVCADGAVPYWRQLLSFFAFLFVPFGFALLARYPKRRRGAAAAFALAIYFLCSVFLAELSEGIAGLFVLAVFFCCLWETQGKRLSEPAVFGAVLLLLGLLSGLATYLREPSLYGRSFGTTLVVWIGSIGSGFLSLLATIGVVPTSEPFLLGREYAASWLAGILPPELDPTGTLDRLTADTRLPSLWTESYLSDLQGAIGFSADTEGYLNFTWFGFVAVFLLCLGVGFLLDRYRRYRTDSVLPRYAACVMLWAALTMPGRSTAHAVRMFVWGVLIVGAILVGKTARNKTD